MFVVNFHGIGKPRRPVDGAEAPYWISEAQFEKLVGFMVSIRNEVRLAITFDDGNSSDFEIAAPQLDRAGLPFEAFPLAGRVGHAGYLSADQIRMLALRGTRIGLHGMHHRNWTFLDDAALHQEIVVARSMLEEITGQKIDSVAVPFGQYDGRVLRALKREGFRRIYTSDGGERLVAGRVRPRCSVTSMSTPGSLFDQMMSARLFRSRIKSELRFQIKGFRWQVRRDRRHST